MAPTTGNTYIVFMYYYPNQVASISVLFISCKVSVCGNLISRLFVVW